MNKSRLFLAALLLILGLGCAIAADEVIVGTNAEFPPFEFTDDNNEIIGYDIDIIKAIGAAAGFEVRMQNQAFDTLVEGLESGKLDATISGMTITEARRRKVDFSDPYYDAAQVIVVLESSEKYRTIEELKDKVVGVQLGTTGAGMAEQVMGETNPNLKQFRRYNEVFSDLRFGRIDAIVVDLPVAQTYLRRLKGMVISSEPMSEEQYGVAIRKGNKELLDKVNAGLAAIRASGEYDAITDKWFQDN